MEHNVIKIATYDLKNPKDYKSFLEIRSDFLEIMSSCYGSRYFGNINYINKIKNKCFIILIAFIIEHEKNVTPIGTIFYKHTGKISGMAVLEDYRYMNIATKLLNQAKKNLKYLFAELDEKNKLMEKLLTRNGFSVITEEKIITTNLASEKEKITIIDKVAKEQCDCLYTFYLQI